MQSSRNHTDDLREELNEFSLNSDFFQKIKSLAEKTKIKLENTFSLLEQKKLILNSIKSIALKNFPEKPFTFEDPEELAYSYFFQILQEPVLKNCKSLSDIENIFDPMINSQENLLKEIQTLLAQEPNRHLSKDRRSWVRQLKNHLHYAAINQQAQTFTLSEHAHLNDRLQNAIHRYRKQLNTLPTLSDQTLNKKIALDQIQDLKSSYQSTKSFFGEKHFCANYIAHHLKKKFSNFSKDNDNQKLNQLLSLEKSASDEARKQFHLFGNRQSRLEKWINEKKILCEEPTDLFAMNIGGRAMTTYLTQLLQKTYYIERSLGYKVKRIFHKLTYNQEQLCILKIRNFVYACVETGIDNAIGIQKLFNTHQFAIQSIKNAHPSLINVFDAIINMNNQSIEKTKTKMGGLENPGLPNDNAGISLAMT